MALIVTAGSSIANSFATLEEASTILAAAPWDTSAWEGIEDPYDSVREGYLIMAARSMDLLPWAGWDVYERQALCHPRTNQADLTVILQDIKEAQVYIADLVIRMGVASMPASTSALGSPTIKSVSLGGLLDVTFASEKLQIESARGGGLLTGLIMSREFPIYLKLMPHLITIRAIGIEDRPDLLPTVVDVEGS